MLIEHSFFNKQTYKHTLKIMQKPRTANKVFNNFFFTLLRLQVAINLKKKVTLKYKKKTITAQCMWHIIRNSLRKIKHLRLKEKKRFTLQHVTLT